MSKNIVTAIIVAAGKSSRMGNSLKSKQLIEISGIPVIIRTLFAFENASLIDNVILVTRHEDKENIKELCNKYLIKKLSFIVDGGDSRQQSVTNGILSCGECDFVAIHDGARPFVTPELIDRVINDAIKYECAAAGVYVKDTIKQISVDGFIENTPSRNTLVAIQTPQVFKFSLYKKALDKANDMGVSYSDDCQLVEHLNKKVYITQGSYENIKITTVEDIIIAQAIIAKK
jgi:2-C-methyl-D-erythritol 4-phosphate cytidylyltransferase